MNDAVLYTLAQVGVTLAGFSGLVVVFRTAGTRTWSRTELRTLWFLIGDSLLTFFFALLPIPLVLWNWSPDAVWASCSALLGSCFLFGNLVVIQGERRDRRAQELVTVPVITPIFRLCVVVAFGIGFALWLSVFNLLVPRGQAIYVLGLITLLVFAGVEFLFFIGLMSKHADSSDGKAH